MDEDNKKKIKNLLQKLIRSNIVCVRWRVTGKGMKKIFEMRTDEYGIVNFKFNIRDLFIFNITLYYTRRLFSFCVHLISYS